MIDAQLRNLEKAVERLSWKHRTTRPGRATATARHYTDRDLEAKSSFVAAAVASRRHRRGSSSTSAPTTASSRASPSTPERSRSSPSTPTISSSTASTASFASEGERRILPLVVDLADPSPAIGWRSRERPAFVERMRPDLVLCLAVVHHLALTNNVPLDEIVAFLADFGAPLVVEFPHRDDVMATRLLARKRSGLFDSYDVANWEKALEQRFTVEDRQELPSGNRTIYRVSPRRRGDQGHIAAGGVQRDGVAVAARPRRPPRRCCPLGRPRRGIR